jgi:hypothetical protein
VTRNAGSQIVVNDEVSDGYWQGMAGSRVMALLIGVLGGQLGVPIGRGHETARALAVRS